MAESELEPRDFSGGPVVKTHASNAGGVGFILGPETKIPHDSQPKKTKHKQQDNIVTNSIKTLKMAHIKKNFFKRDNHSDVSV